MSKTQSPQWPKPLPRLTEEQERVREDFHRHWLEVLPSRFGLIEEFNQRYPLRTFAPGIKTLEIGAGIGAHLRYEDLAHQEYVALELRQELAQVIREGYPTVRVTISDCQAEIKFPNDLIARSQSTFSNICPTCQEHWSSCGG